VKRDKKDDKKSGWNKPPDKPRSKSRIDTGMTSLVKLKLLDATRKAIIDKSKATKQFVNSYVQTDSFKTKLCKDVSIENQSDMVQRVDESTETDVEMVAMKARDGTCEWLS
jgi:hypothetical protein